jgi:uncharacterized protein YbaP (TraB family)
VDSTTLRRCAVAGLTLLGVGLACASPLPSPPPPRTAGYRYVDAQLGVALELPAAWRAFERREDLPEALRDLIPSGFGPKPAMVALREGDQAFARVLTENVLGLSVLDYFDLLLRATQDKLEVLDAAYSHERDALRWRYRVKAGALEFTFVETIVVRRRHAIRVAFWASSPLASYYDAEFESIAAGVLLFEEPEWVAPWQDLAASLDSNYFQSLSFAVEGEPEQAPDCERPPQGLLWSVATAKGTMFLFPSFHLGHPDLYPLPPRVESAFAGSQRLVVEVDARSQRVEEVRSGRATGPSAAASPIELRPEQRAEIDRRMSALGVQAKTWERSPPWSLAVMLEFLEWQALGYYAEFGVERYLLDRASGRNVIELESAEEQMALLERNGGQLLDSTLQSLDEFGSRIRPMIAAWYCGGPDAFSEVAGVASANPMPVELRQVFLDDRNEAMVDRLEPLLDEPGVTFVTVGFAHFFGPTGLPALLEARGHPVEGP